MQDKYSFVYIMTNYINKVAPGFTKKYNINKLVYYEIFENLYVALEREKQIKAGSRANKIKLIESKNPNWQDLYDSLD